MIFDSGLIAAHCISLPQEGAARQQEGGGRRARCEQECISDNRDAEFKVSVAQIKTTVMTCGMDCHVATCSFDPHVPLATDCWDIPV